MYVYSFNNKTSQNFHDTWEVTKIWHFSEIITKFMRNVWALNENISEDF